MFKTGLVASILFGCICVSTSWAVDLTLFEQDFLRSKGKPDSYAKSFVAQGHQAKLIISNGEEINSASVVY